jgi:SAM-dependent methyltransferase
MTGCKHLENIKKSLEILLDKLKVYELLMYHDVVEIEAGDMPLHLNNDLDTSNMPKDMDLLIANDFLEHIQNPANILLKAKSILKPNGRVFISVPNWRMGHAWIYRGLFDWDNFIHFMWQHGFAIEGYQDSPLKTPYMSKIQSESTMPDEMIQSWNFYMLFKRNDNE